MLFNTQCCHSRIFILSYLHYICNYLQLVRFNRSRHVSTFCKIIDARAFALLSVRVRRFEWLICTLNFLNMNRVNLMLFNDLTKHMSNFCKHVEHAKLPVSITYCTEACDQRLVKRHLTSGASRSRRSLPSCIRTQNHTPNLASAQHSTAQHSTSLHSSRIRQKSAASSRLIHRPMARCQQQVPAK